ncbi:MAG: hypothetical protein ACK43K_04000, partial [Chitinophagales bacterium]
AKFAEFFAKSRKFNKCFVAQSDTKLYHEACLFVRQGCAASGMTRSHIYMFPLIFVRNYVKFRIKNSKLLPLSYKSLILGFINVYASTTIP